MTTITHGRLAGRCANGGELDGGTRIHLLEAFEHGHAEKALCGATYGRRSAGWSLHNGPATCSRCIDRFCRLHAKAGPGSLVIT